MRRQLCRLARPRPPIIRFELAGNLIPGGFDPEEDPIPDTTDAPAAVPVDAWIAVLTPAVVDPLSAGYPDVYEGDLDQPIVVWDAFGCLFAWGRLQFGDPIYNHGAGAMGYALWMDDHQRYEIIGMEEITVILGVLEADEDEDEDDFGSGQVSLWYNQSNDSGIDVQIRPKRSDQTPWLGDEESEEEQFQEGDNVVLVLDQQNVDYYILAGPAKEVPL